MKPLDFVFYYLVMFFEKRKNKGVNVDPINRTIYVISICSILWLMLIAFVTEYCYFGTFATNIPLFVFVILGAIIFMAIDYIYVKKRRYAEILERNDPKFDLSDTAGISISIIFIVITFVFILLAAIILHNIK